MSKKLVFMVLGKVLQAQMTGEAENTGLTTDEAVMELVKEVRAESEGE